VDILGTKFKRIHENDLELIMKWRTLPEVTKYMYTDPNLTLDDQVNWFKKIKKDQKVSYWLIEFNGKKVGVVNFYDIDLKNHRAFWAYYIGDFTTRGKGLGRIIECNIYDYAFYKLGLNKLCCEVLSFNKKVVEIHKHFGSKIEGVFKQHIYKQNKFFDVVRMAILKEEWEVIRKNFQYETSNFEK
jgi:hypothetical protein